MVLKILNALITVGVGVAAAVVLYWVLNKLAEVLPGRWEDRIKPYLYILPAYAALVFYLVYPAVQTLVFSFANATSTEWVGMDNYTKLLQSSGFQDTLFNTLLWMAVVPVFTVILGLQDDHLPADGHQRRRRGHRVGPGLQLPPRGS
jgi:alpha-glucoside transport system permease protein